MWIRVGLPRELKKGLTILLKENVDIYAWEATDMIGIPRQLVEHKLNEKAGSKPIRQKNGIIKRKELSNK